jgi:hypothetical protein
MTHRGFAYEHDVDCDDNVTKISHYAVNGQERVTIPFTPYADMTAASFAAWIDLGMPSNAAHIFGGNGSYNFTNDHLKQILAISEKFAIPLADIDGIRMAIKLTK